MVGSGARKGFSGATLQRDRASGTGSDRRIRVVQGIDREQTRGVFRRDDRVAVALLHHL